MSPVEAIVAYERKKSGLILDAVTKLDPQLQFSFRQRSNSADYVGKRAEAMAKAALYHPNGPHDLGALVEKFEDIDVDSGNPPTPGVNPERMTWIEQVTLFYRDLMAKPVSTPNTNAGALSTSITYDTMAQALGEVAYREHMRRIDKAETALFAARRRAQQQRRPGGQSVSTDAVLEQAQALVRERETLRIFKVRAPVGNAFS